MMAFLQVKKTVANVRTSKRMTAVRRRARNGPS